MSVKYKIVGPHGVCVKREGVCFSGIPTQIGSEDIYKSDGKYRLVYTMTSRKRTQLDYLYIRQVLQHSIFRELYDAKITFHKYVIDFNIKIMENYLATIFYLTLARYLDEGREVVRAWAKLFYRGIDPLQALVLAEAYTDVPRPHMSHRLTGYVRNRSTIPFKDWPRFMVQTLSTEYEGRGGIYYPRITEAFARMQPHKFLPKEDWNLHTLRSKVEVPRLENWRKLDEVIQVLQQPQFETYTNKEMVQHEA